MCVCVDFGKVVFVSLYVLSDQRHSVITRHSWTASSEPMTNWRREFDTSFCCAFSPSAY